MGVQLDWLDTSATFANPARNLSDNYPHTPTARAGSPETAFVAAESMADAAKSREAKALALIRASGSHGCTADEVAEALGWERYSARPRLSQLKARRETIDSGNRREGASGRMQAVWIASDLATG